MVVNGLKSWFTAALPEYWLFVLGAIFVGVTLYLPAGLLGLAKQVAARLRRPAPEVQKVPA
jgi:urea transport system permease protein